ncbi:MAG TPA: Flp pilus assembly protein CpaB [Gaiellaceae bacterium]|nr:Flp pilus assembly protein CpaB [Gaiellaceae bacterium]
MNYRLRNIVLAVGLAALAAILTSFYVANYKKTVRADEANVTVYVATKEIPVGTPGQDVLDDGLLRAEKVARRTVVPGAISQPSQVKDLVATETVYEGEQVSVRRFKAVEAAGVQGELRGNLRAVQVDGNVNQLLAGTVKRGDHVDVVAVFTVKRNNDEDEFSVSRVVLRDIQVLKAADTTLASERVGGDSGEVSVQLALTDAQTQKLEFSRKVATGWTLALRPVADATDSPESLETVSTLLCDGMRPGAYPSVCFGRN